MNRALARRTDPTTSRDAAASITSERLSACQEGVLACLGRFHYGVSDETLVEVYEDLRRLLDWPRQSPQGIRSRRKELSDMGLLVECGEGVTASGRRCRVWRAA